MELIIEQALQQGVAAHKEGRITDAKLFYRSILQFQPSHPDANHNLGLLAASCNQDEAALVLFKTALAENPKMEQFWLSFITALIKTGKYDDARQAMIEAKLNGVATAKLYRFQEKLQLEEPGSFDAPLQGISSVLSTQQNDLRPAIELRELGEYRKAQEWLEKVIELDSNNAEALSLLSQVLLLRKKETEAETALITAAAINSELPSVYRNRARLLLQQSKVAEALKIAQFGHEQSPQDSETLLVLSACLGANKKDQDALEIIEKLLNANPDYAEAYANRALIKLREKNVIGAIEDAEKAVSIKPHLGNTWALLGLLYYQAKKLAVAIGALRKAHNNDPENVAIMIQLGKLLIQYKNPKEAIPILQKATEFAPKDANAWGNLGMALQQDNRIEAAKAAYARTLGLNPRSSGVLYNLGAISKDAGDLEAALQYFGKATEIEPNFAKAHGNLGIVFRRLGKFSKAEASYRKAIESKRDYAEAHLNLIELLDRTNNIDALMLALQDAKTNITDKLADFLFYEALGSFRQERHSKAIKLFSQINENDVSDTIKASYYKLKGDLCHYNKDYDAAFLAFQNSNCAVKEWNDYKRYAAAAERHFDLQKSKAADLKELTTGVPFSNSASATWLQPTFLIGFPRSGTTLLDVILRSHSNIDVVEEQPMVSKMLAALGETTLPSMIEKIDIATTKIASDAYFQELKKHTDLADVDVLIDKLPLNILDIPLINRIFPKAKYILALRHPFDCILSCWMQTFELNPSMANMVNLDRIVDFYGTAMEILKFSQSRYQIDIHRIRYEDLIENFEGETSGILRFLDLDWEDELLDYRSAALARGIINTPSRSQVIKPIYKSASYRWKHYEQYLEDFKPSVNPWIEEFGY